MISAENIVKRYGDKYAVNDVSFTVGDGEIVGFLGPNGAGKSTTMNILTGYLSSTSGTAKIDGFDILDDPTEAKKHIGYLPEIPPLYLDMTVEEYLNFVYDLKSCTLNRKKHIKEICDVTKISDVYKRVIKHLSKGYRQRIGIAQALIGNPKVLIFDEPTIGLDPKQIIEIRNLIRMLGRDHSVILSTHILSEVQAVCDRIIVINKGKIVADEATEKIINATNESMRINIKICGPKKEVLSALKEVVGVAYAEAIGENDFDSVTFLVESDAGVDIRKSLFNMCARKNWPIIGLEAAGASLEDVFMSLVNRSESQNKGKRSKISAGKKNAAKEEA
ncbi:MAG: ATP-binding cassette domain-containing protein [Ruminococcaceae bacterium]|nr:ATP-binding cassette domain-containing protein [Oscillospiraceae bacterium]